MGVLERIKEEPVAFQGLIQAGLAVFVAFGLKLDGKEMGALLALSAAILTFAARTQVTPIANPKTGEGSRLVPTAGLPIGDGAKLS